MLARQELSSAQVRDRLNRKGFTESEVEDAVRRLEAEGAIDDGRAAAAYAHQSATVKLRGRARTLRELHARGINPSDAAAAVEHTYAALDEAALLDRAIRRRLEGRIESRAQFRRLYQALLRLGFDGSAVATALLAKADMDEAPERDRQSRRPSVKK